MRVRGTHSDLLAALLIAVAFGAGKAARAEDTIYGPDGAPTVVQRKLHTMTGRWEAGLAGGIALNTSLVNQYATLLSISYQFGSPKLAAEPAPLK